MGPPGAEADRIPRGTGVAANILTDRRTSDRPIDAGRPAAHGNGIISSSPHRPLALPRPASSEVLVKSTRAVRILSAVTVAILLGWVMILCPLSADAEPVVSEPAAPGPVVVAVQQGSRITVNENALDHGRHSMLCSFLRVGIWTKRWCSWLD